MELRIKQAIKERGFTIQKVSELIGKSKQSLHGIIENGNPTIGVLNDIANAIGCQISDLYVNDVAPSPTLFRCPHCGKPIAIDIKIGSE